MHAFNWQGQQFELGGMTDIVCVTYTYAFISRYVQGQIGQSILVMRRRDRPVWELPGGLCSNHLVGMEAVKATCAKVLSLPVTPVPNDDKRPEYFFTQMMYMDYGLLMNVSAVTYRASLPRGREDDVTSAVTLAYDIAKLEWVPIGRFRRENTHPLCWPTLALFQKYQRDELPL